MSSTEATRLSGVAAAVLSFQAWSRPGTKSVATTPGETVRMRMAGARARASAEPITSRAAFAARGADRRLGGDRGDVDPQPVAAGAQLRREGANGGEAAAQVHPHHLVE